MVMPDFEAQIVIERPAGDGSMPSDRSECPVYHPGQSVRGHVIVITKAPQTPISLTIGIECAANSSRLSMLELTLHEGSVDRDQRSFPFEFECPTEPLSHHGPNAVVEWSLLATLEVPHVRPVRDRSSVCVLAPSDARPIISTGDVRIDTAQMWKTARRVLLAAGLVIVIPTSYIALLSFLPDPWGGSVPVYALPLMAVCDVMGVAITYSWLQRVLARSPVSKLTGRLQPEPDGTLRVDVDVTAIGPVNRVSVELAFENSALDRDEHNWHVAHERFVRHDLPVEGGKHAAGSVRFTLPDPRLRGLWNFETANLTSGWVVLITVDVDGRDELRSQIPFSVTPGPRSC
jgi:hypothetical protein